MILCTAPTSKVGLQHQEKCGSLKLPGRKNNATWVGDYYVAQINDIFPYMYMDLTTKVEVPQHKDHTNQPIARVIISDLSLVFGLNAGNYHFTATKNRDYRF